MKQKKNYIAENCFANIDGVCNILKETDCKESKFYKSKTKRKEDDCFANGNGICTVLTETQCIECKFYKNKAQLKKERYRCNQRLVSKYQRSIRGKNESSVQ